MSWTFYKSDGSVLTSIGTGATTITVTDNESTNENNVLTFVAGADADGGDVGLESDGNLHYNPSTGLLTSTGFSGTLTGTLQTASQTNITAVGTIGTGVWQGTAVASGYIAADAITGAKLADDAVNSEHYTDASIDTAHIGNLQITTALIAADAVTAAKIADDAINSEHYTNASIDNAHLADDAVDSDELAAGAVDIAHLSASGTASSSTFLRGDNAWTAVAVPTEASQANAEDEATGTYYIPPDLLKYSPGVAKGYGRIAGSDGAATESYGLTTCTRNSTGVYLINADPEFSGATMVPLAQTESASANSSHVNRFSDGSRWEVTTHASSSGTAVDDDSFTVAWGELV